MGRIFGRGEGGHTDDPANGQGVVAGTGLKIPVVSESIHDDSEGIEPAPIQPYPNEGPLFGDGEIPDETVEAINELVGVLEEHGVVGLADDFFDDDEDEPLVICVELLILAPEGNRPKTSILTDVQADAAAALEDHGINVEAAQTTWGKPGPNAPTI